MSQSAKSFALLLTKAIRKISVGEDKLISTVQDELGYALGRKGGTAIEYWRKGHIPAKQVEIEILARELVKRGNLSQEWLRQFLISAEFPNVTALSHELFPVTPDLQLPVRTYRRLVGREALVHDILTALREPVGRWIITIDGMGGIGKTALAREIAERSTKGQFFEQVIWISRPRGEPTHGSGDSGLIFEAIWDEIGRQLGDTDISDRTVSEKEEQLRNLLRKRRVLIVLDNLETFGDAQNEISQRLQPLLDYSKSLLISRHRFSGHGYAVHLTGLDRGSSEEFIRQEAREKRVGHVATASIKELAQITQATGGSPLAVKLVIGQLCRLPLDIVLDHLTRVRSLRGRTEHDDYVQFYRYIFAQSWGLLSGDSQRLLVSMSHFAPELGGDLEAIKCTSDLAEPVLVRSIDELWRFSFLEIGESTDLRQVRYYLHTLTRNFVLSDIVQVL